MEARLKRKALTLWRAFAQSTYTLDVEAIEALLLRDKLEGADLGQGERHELDQLDQRVANSRASCLEQLVRSGAMPSIKRLRKGERASGKWWWFLDREPNAPGTFEYAVYSAILAAPIAMLVVLVYRLLR